MPDTPDLQLSTTFALREFLYSETAERAGRAVVPTPEVIDNLRLLCTSLLQPIRDQLGLPIVITSGYRPAWLNAMIGGSSKTSAHMRGLAADVRVIGMRPLNFSRWVAEKGFVFDQCIYEGTWTHLGIVAPGLAPRMQLLTAHFSATGVTYSNGLG